MRTGRDLIADYIISTVRKYEHDNLTKFIGAGLPRHLRQMSPTLCPRLWAELDIVPICMRPDREQREGDYWDDRLIDEQADSMARKCLM